MNSQLTVKDVCDADLDGVEFNSSATISTTASIASSDDTSSGDRNTLLDIQQTNSNKNTGNSSTHKHKTRFLCSNKVRDHPQSTVRTIDNPELKGHNNFTREYRDTAAACSYTINTNNNGTLEEESAETQESACKVCNRKDPTSSTDSGNQDKLKEAWKRPETSNIVMTAGKYGVCLSAGFIFGMAIQKGAVYEPRVIRGQFIYEKFIMLKMFLSAVSVGALSLALLSIFAKASFDRAYTAYTSCLTRKGVVGVLIGGFLLGAGMTVAGACPGMVLVQVGAWVGQGKALMTLFGCLVGVLAYSLMDPYLAKFLMPRKPYEKQAVAQWIHLPFCVLALGLALVTGAIVFVLEWFFPWREELFVPNIPADWFYLLLAWPPAVAGVLIGLLQLPLVFTVGDTVGGSSAYCTIVSQLLVTKSMEEKVPYLALRKRGVANWWQVLYVCGAIFGGAMSAFASGSMGSVPGVSLQSSFIGGFLMLFGARMAGGCTSGHGLSGVGLLMALSMLAAASMFAGGTIVGFICLGLDKANLIDYYTF